MITKLIYFLHRLLSSEQQRAMTLRLVSVVFPGRHPHRDPPKGVKRPRKYPVKGE